MKSIFTEKSTQPNEELLEQGIGNTYKLWLEILNYALKLVPDATHNWHFSGEKYGWSYRISDKKRVIIYLLPRGGFFKVAMVFGQKATDDILQSKIGESIKSELLSAKVYAEGRGIRIDITKKTQLNDIKILMDIKVSH